MRQKKNRLTQQHIEFRHVVNDEFVETRRQQKASFFVVTIANLQTKNKIQQKQNKKKKQKIFKTRGKIKTFLLANRCEKPIFKQLNSITFGMRMVPLKRRRTRESIPFGLRQFG